MPAALLAQEEERGRPYRQLINEYFLTGSVYPQEQGEVQLTLLPSVSASETDRTVLPFAVEYGISDRWQVEVEWSPLTVVEPEQSRRRSSVGDVELSTQYSFMRIGGSMFHAALGFGVSLPTGDLERGTTEGFVEYEPSLAVARDLEALDGLQLFGQVALGLVDRVEQHDDPADDEPAAHEVNLSAGVLLPMGDARFVAEFHWTTNEWNNGGEESELYLSPGLVWDLPGTWEAGFAVPMGISLDADDIRFMLVVLYEFEIDG